jgi:hypothetical protein
MQYKNKKSDALLMLGRSDILSTSLMLLEESPTENSP